MKKLLVTGGAGYVGSHCCKLFAEAGWEVTVFDNLSTGWREFVQWGDLIEGDLLDRTAVNNAVNQVKPDAVAHFAALSLVGVSVSSPETYYRNNVLGSLNLMEAMTDADVNKMIFSSTCATYGIPQHMPIDESHPQAPINPYGSSKLMVERILADYSKAHDFKYVALRYFNAAGADAAARIGERHEPETHVIPLAIRGAMTDDYTFTILGDDFDTRDGTCVRDYIHVDDLADAHKRALDYLFAGGKSDVFNLGTGKGTTVKEIAAAVEKASGKPLNLSIGARRAGDPAALYSDPRHAKDILGWEAKHSDIDNIVGSAWKWHQK